MISILVVDDEQSMRDFLKIMLKKEGYQVQTAGNGDMALSSLKEGSFDLVISDIRMPDMRGDEVLSYLKANVLFKDIPVIMLSSEDSTSERIKFLDGGAADYIVKPFNPLELKVRILKIIGKA